MNFLFYYPETSGVTVSNIPSQPMSNIIQFNAILTSLIPISNTNKWSFNILTKFSSLIKPDDNAVITQEAIQLNELQDTLNTLPDKSYVMNQFINNMKPYLKDEKALIVGFNNYKFWDFMLDKLINNKSTNSEFYNLFHLDTIDLKSLLNLYIFPFKAMLINNKFETYCKLFNVDIKNPKLMPYGKVVGLISMYTHFMNNGSFINEEHWNQIKGQLSLFKN